MLITGNKTHVSRADSLDCWVSGGGTHLQIGVPAHGDHDVLVVSVTSGGKTLDSKTMRVVGDPDVKFAAGEAERARVTKELAKVESELAKVKAKLADENFTSKVPQKVLDEHQLRKTDWQEKLAKLREMMSALG